MSIKQEIEADPAHLGVHAATSEIVVQVSTFPSGILKKICITALAITLLTGSAHTQSVANRIQAVPDSHPLSWWTRNPLRLDKDGSLQLGKSPDDGHIITARDYRVVQNVTTLGIVADHKIIEILLTIYAGPRLFFSGLAPAKSPSFQWKTLLVEVGTGNKYVEIYSLHADEGLQLPMKSAAVYGSGQDAILGTFDPSGGNGGGCSDGYWWFDATGAHPLDFSLLNEAITRALPSNGMYTQRCWALHPEKTQLDSWVQRKDAECHACGGLGEMVATYKVQHGAATPISVTFLPYPQDQK